MHAGSGDRRYLLMLLNSRSRRKRLSRLGTASLLYDLRNNNHSPSATPSAAARMLLLLLLLLLLLHRLRRLRLRLLGSVLMR